MKKKIILSFLAILIVSGFYFAWKIFGPGTSFSGQKYNLFIRTGMNFNAEMKILREDNVLESPSLFSWLAARLDYPKNIKAGKYEIKKGVSLADLIRMLRNGRQTPVNLVITKFRTKEDLSGYVGKRYECDSSSFMNYLQNSDSLREFGLDSNTVMTAVFPDTYTLFWNMTPSRIFRKLYNNYKAYWTPGREKEAADHGLTPVTAYILASLVEEETNKAEDRPVIASVYLNRIGKGMKLDADPTIKYALRQFELKRIYEKYLAVESPYNTYKYPGLPPGPVCTPSRQSLEAVLTAPKTNYIYFVARPDFSGYSNFSENFSQHLVYAKAYQKALDAEMAKRAAGEDTIK